MNFMIHYDLINLPIPQPVKDNSEYIRISVNTVVASMCLGRLQAGVLAEHLGQHRGGAGHQGRPVGGDNTATYIQCYPVSQAHKVRPG